MNVEAALVKCYLIMLVANICQAFYINLDFDSWQPRKLRYIPRYITQKEIRGPTFHIHHAIEEKLQPMDSTGVRKVDSGRTSQMGPKLRLHARHSRTFEHIQPKHTKVVESIPLTSDSAEDYP